MVIEEKRYLQIVYSKSMLVALKLQSSDQLHHHLKLVNAKYGAPLRTY